MATACIIVAAGIGVRMGSRLPKALMPVAGRPLVAWAIEAARASGVVDEFVIVAPRGRLRDIEAVVGADEHLTVVAGGETRAHSVAAGLEAISEEVEVVLVHDAARPLARPELFRAVYEALSPRVDGAIAAAPLADTLKRARPDRTIGETVDRQGLWLAQTPQCFHVAALRSAYERLDDDEISETTDCASIVERAGGTVVLVASSAANLKVTLPSDVALAEYLLVAAGA